MLQGLTVGTVAARAFPGARLTSVGRWCSVDSFKQNNGSGRPARSLERRCCRPLTSGRPTSAVPEVLAG